MFSVIVLLSVIKVWNFAEHLMLVLCISRVAGALRVCVYSQRPCGFGMTSNIVRLSKTGLLVHWRDEGENGQEFKKLHLASKNPPSTIGCLTNTTGSFLSERKKVKVLSNWIKYIKIPQHLRLKGTINRTWISKTLLTDMDGNSLIIKSLSGFRVGVDPHIKS